MTNQTRGENQAEAIQMGVELHWLDGKPAMFNGTTCGVPWPCGAMQRETAFAIEDERGTKLPVQTWPLAYWPDGTLKWTAHAISPQNQPSSPIRLVTAKTTASGQVISVHETPQAIEVNTGTMKCCMARTGGHIVSSVELDGRVLAKDAELVCLKQDSPDIPEEGAVKSERFTGSIEKVTVEQSGPIRAVVKVEGRHKDGERQWLPFTVRFYFYAGSSAIRVMHTFVYDGNENTDFIRGLGLRFTVPMRDEMYDRHVRFTGEGSGLWAEAVKTVTGLRRDAGPAARTAQVEGRALPPLEQIDSRVTNRLHYVPAWGDFTLSQLSADGFEIRKRTKAGYGWIAAGSGRRASGAGCIGGASGGMAFGIRDFWQKHPTQLDIRNAASQQAEVTMWLWSPDAPAMDIRYYHDGMGMTTHPEEVEAMNITYEDYEKGWGSPMGVARTSEMMLWAVSATPSRQQMVDFAKATNTPPLLVCKPEHYLEAKTFGAIWTLPDRSTPAKALIEDQLDFSFDYYRKQVEQREWYGFWDYGDVMHSYDSDRHVWRYDVGGFAWDNSELSPDLWLWYSFLRTGRADIFRMAEAMTRHTGEVDVHHIGKFKGLGSRHNVQHWGCSCKQLRISNVMYRRFYYFLTADERVGDLMREQLDADLTFLTVDPQRKVRRNEYIPRPDALDVGTGNNWGCIAAAWLTEWERTGDAKYRDRLMASMKSIGRLPHGFFTNGTSYDPNTSTFNWDGSEGGHAGGLTAVFGLPEVCAELLIVTDVPEFRKAWLDYCKYYSASRQDRLNDLGIDFDSGSLASAHSRLTAYAAWQLGDPHLAKRAWGEFLGNDAPEQRRSRMTTKRIEGPAVLNPIDEAAGVGTNGTSQWGLSAIQNLALAAEVIPEMMPSSENR
jgi:hypothetical protein